MGGGLSVQRTGHGVALAVALYVSAAALYGEEAYYSLLLLLLLVVVVAGRCPLHIYRYAQRWGGRYELRCSKHKE